MLMLTLVAAAAFFGGLLGGLVRRRLDRQGAEPVTVERFVIDPLAAAEMDQAAAAWSQAHGRPETEGLLADKLRLAYTLKHQLRPAKHWGRWGR